MVADQDTGWRYIGKPRKGIQCHDGCIDPGQLPGHRGIDPWHDPLCAWHTADRITHPLRTAIRMGILHGTARRHALPYRPCSLELSVAELQFANCLGNSTLIRAGTRIFVPNVPTRTPTTAPTRPVPTTSRPSNTPSEMPTSTPTIPPSLPNRVNI